MSRVRDRLTEMAIITVAPPHVVLGARRTDGPAPRNQGPANTTKQVTLWNLRCAATAAGERVSGAGVA